MSALALPDWVGEGLRWESILYFRESAGAVLKDVYGGGPAQVVCLPSTADPTWQGQGDDRRIYIGEFSPQRRIHLWRWLMRRADGIEMRVSLAEGAGPLAPMGDAQDAFDEMCDERADDPQGWMAETPFMLALGALLLGDGNGWVIDGRPQPCRPVADGPEWWES